MTTGTWIAFALGALLTALTVALWTVARRSPGDAVAIAAVATAVAALVAFAAFAVSVSS